MLNASQALQSASTSSGKLAGSRLIITRLGGWKTALGAFRHSPSFHVESSGKIEPIKTCTPRSNYAFGWSIRAFWAAYERFLLAAPIRTQGCAMTLIWGTGDFVAQTLEGRRWQEIDLRRLTSTALYGGIFLAPVGHLWYQALDRFISLRYKPASLRFVITKVSLDNLLFTPLHVALFFSWFNFAAEQGTLEGLAAKLTKDYCSTVLVELFVWPAWQLFTFRAVPLHHQLMTSNMLTLGEATALPIVNAERSKAVLDQ